MTRHCDRAWKQCVFTFTKAISLACLLGCLLRCNCQLRACWVPGVGAAHTFTLDFRLRHGFLRKCIYGKCDIHVEIRPLSFCRGVPVLFGWLVIAVVGLVWVPTARIRCRMHTRPSLSNVGQMRHVGQHTSGHGEVCRCGGAKPAGQRQTAPLSHSTQPDDGPFPASFHVRKRFVSHSQWLT